MMKVIANTYFDHKCIYILYVIYIYIYIYIICVCNIQFTYIIDDYEYGGRQSH